MGFPSWPKEYNGLQKMRIDRAKEASTTPLSVNRVAGTGEFCGASGYHHTTLDSCTCQDFQKRGFPCKHIYRLAMELGKMNCSFVSDPSRIVRPSCQPVEVKCPELFRAVSAIERINLDAQKCLRDLLYRVLYRDEFVPLVPYSQALDVLVQVGLVALYSGPYQAAEDMEDDQLCDLIHRYDRNTAMIEFSYNEALAWIKTNLGTPDPLFAGKTPVNMSPLADVDAQSLFFYLVRRNESSTLTEGKHAGEVVPKGSYYYGRLLPNGEVVDVLTFKDDEITELLNMFNANRCHEINYRKLQGGK